MEIDMRESGQRDQFLSSYFSTKHRLPLCARSRTDLTLFTRHPTAALNRRVYCVGWSALVPMFPTAQYVPQAIS
jgi:hypothetical protein